jgi:phosphatidate cytidylyltransferase
MAFNTQVFKTRTLTAIIFAAVMLTGLLWNHWSFLILFTVIHFGCWWEFVKLLKKVYAQRYLVYCFFGLLYITLPILMIIDLRIEIVYETFSGESGTGYFTGFSTGSYLLPCAIVFSIWINDTMAYIVGSLIGKTPLSKISPKKTWEGTLGGIILATIIAWIIAWQFDFDIKTMVVIALVSSIAGTFGDLFESKLKRMAGVKDSGSFMPGHGGFLDRFDSLLFAIPFVWLFLKLMTN